MRSCDSRLLSLLVLLTSRTIYSMAPAPPAPVVTAGKGASGDAAQSVDGTIGELLAWAHKHGMRKDSPVSPSFCPESNCRGMVATRAISEGEIVLQIPEAMMMSLDTAMEDYEIRSVVARSEEQGISLSERQILALHLLLEQEKGTASRWYPFLQSIPASYDTVEFWTEEEVEQLQLPSLVATARARRAKIVAEYKSLVKLLSGREDLGSGEPRFRVALFVWAVATISTRSCSFEHRAAIPRLGDERAGALVPVLDLLNHSPEQPSVAECGFARATRDYQVRAQRAYRAGEQVLIHYGPWSNAQLLDMYGFALPARHSADSFTLHAPRATPLPASARQRKHARDGAECATLEEVAEVMASMGKELPDGAVGTLQGFELFSAGEGDGEAEVAWNLAAVVRWNALDGAEVLGLGPRILEADRGSPLSPAHEERAMRALVALLQEEFTAASGGPGTSSSLCSSMEQDAQILLRISRGDSPVLPTLPAWDCGFPVPQREASSTAAATAMRLAVEVRLGAKRVLLENVRTAEIMLQEAQATLR